MHQRKRHLCVCVWERFYWAIYYYYNGRRPKAKFLGLEKFNSRRHRNEQVNLRSTISVKNIGLGVYRCIFYIYHVQVWVRNSTSQSSLVLWGTLHIRVGVESNGCGRRPSAVPVRAITNPYKCIHVVGTVLSFSLLVPCVRFFRRGINKVTHHLMLC
jgi:hypothetical protein